MPEKEDTAKKDEGAQGEQQKETKGTLNRTMYAIVNENLRDLEPFTGDPSKISWDMFEYKFMSALEMLGDFEGYDKVCLAMLRQKLQGPPAELIRLDPALQEMGFDQTMSWLALRYQDLHPAAQESRTWQQGDTPDAYLARITRSAENDLAPMPPRKIEVYKDADKTEFVKVDGKVKMEDNPEYDLMLKKRKDYRETIDASIRRDYYAGLKPSIKRKIPDPPKKLDELHAMVRRIYLNELKYPDMADDVPAAQPRQTNLPVFNTQTQATEQRVTNQGNYQGRQGGMYKNNDVRKAMNNMKDVTQTLAKAMVKMTENGMVKPTARAGTARDSTGTLPTPTKCFHCQEVGHMARECPMKINFNIRTTAQPQRNVPGNLRPNTGFAPRPAVNFNYQPNRNSFNPGGFGTAVPYAQAGAYGPFDQPRQNFQSFRTPAPGRQFNSGRPRATTPQPQRSFTPHSPAMQRSRSTSRPRQSQGFQRPYTPPNVAARQQKPYQSSANRPFQGRQNPGPGQKPKPQQKPTNQKPNQSKNPGQKKVTFSARDKQRDAFITSMACMMEQLGLEWEAEEQENSKNY